jgi:DNA helicase-2/ATP-dependent DNA helicase PcrA
MLPDAFDKVANLEEFYGLYRDFIKTNPSDSLDDFLHEIALQSDQDQIQNDSIYIMSVHASKGLEFGHVIIIGLEEKFLPITGDGSDLEEERRLGYVAFTRAKDSLILSTVKSRFYKGRRDTLTKSRFLKESGVIEGSLTLESSTGYKKGDLVKHKIFGNGRVTGVSKAGRDFKLTINFSGNKREILASFVEKI